MWNTLALISWKNLIHLQSVSVSSKFKNALNFFSECENRLYVYVYNKFCGSVQPFRWYFYKQCNFLLLINICYQLLFVDSSSKINFLFSGKKQNGTAVRTNSLGSGTTRTSSLHLERKPVSTATTVSKFSALGRLFKPWKWKRKKKSEKFEAASRCKCYYHSYFFSNKLYSFFLSDSKY